MTLYVVATPLGNLDDLSDRARAVLGGTTPTSTPSGLRPADLIVAEDTRRTKGLLHHLGATGIPVWSLHRHNEAQQLESVLERLRSGGHVALVSDAGTPAVSDPGAYLVAAAHAEDITVSPIPGPSALIAAVSSAGFPMASTDLWFVGFLPPKKRTAILERIAAHPGVVVLFEGPHHLLATLRDLASVGPQRPLCMCRELSKLHEEIRRTTVAELLAAVEHEKSTGSAADTWLRGELTLVLGPALAADMAPEGGDETVLLDTAAVGPQAVDAALRRCLRGGLSKKDASKAVALVFDLPKRQVYGRCEKLPPLR